MCSVADEEVSGGVTGQQSPLGAGTKETAVSQPSDNKGCSSHPIHIEEDDDDSEVAAGKVQWSWFRACSTYASCWNCFLDRHVVMFEAYKPVLCSLNNFQWQSRNSRLSMLHILHCLTVLKARGPAAHLLIFRYQQQH